MKHLLLVVLSFSLVLLGGCFLYKENTQQPSQNTGTFIDSGSVNETLTGETTKIEDLSQEDEIQEYVTEDDVVIPAEQKEDTDKKIEDIDQKVNKLIEERKETINPESDELTEEDIELIEGILEEITK